MRKHQQDRGDGSKSLDVPFGRRTFVGLAAGGIALGALGGSMGSAVADSHRPSNYVDLGDQGLEPGDDISPYLDHFVDDGNEVHIPAGTYEYDGRSGDGTFSDNAWIIGDGDVVLDVGDGGATDLDYRVDSGAGAVHVRVQNLTISGRIGEDGNVGVAAEDPDGIIEFINFNRPDGCYPGVGQTGTYVDNEHAGLILFVNCHYEGFTDNGIYASSPGEGDSNDGFGAIEVYGGLYRNNDVTNIRIGTPDTKVVSTVSVVDDIPDGQETGWHRGIWIREAGDNMVIHDCDISSLDIDGAGPPIIVQDTSFEGPSPSNTVITDTRIRNDTDNEALDIKEEYEISGDNIHLTGSGDLELQGSGPFTNVVYGSDARSPTREKRWVEWDGVDQIDDGGSTSDTDPVVTTDGAADVTEESATLTGTLDSLGGASSAEVSFEWGLAGETLDSATPATSFSSPSGFAADLSGLDPSETYAYRAVASAADGDTDAGSTIEFTTGSATLENLLAIETFSGSGILYQFTVDGEVQAGEYGEPNGNDSITDNGDGTYTVEGDTGNGYSDDWQFTGQVTAWSAERHPEEDSGEYELYLNGAQVTPEELTGESDTDPVVTTDGATDVTEESATLTGTLDSLGEASEAEVAFEWGPAGGSLPNTAGARALGSPGTFTADIGGLDPQETYAFRAVASATDGDTDTGSVAEFTTDEQETTLPNSIIIDATNGGKSKYRFTVSGELEKDAVNGSIQSSDVISGSTAEGEVHGGIDAYRFSGDITEYRLRGNAEVTIDDND